MPLHSANKAIFHYTACKMDERFYTITKKDLYDLFERLSKEYDVTVPCAKGDKLYFDKFSADRSSAIELGIIRQSQPLKSFLNPAREKVFDGPQTDKKPMVIAGVKSCDLQGLIVQDFVFSEGDPKDPTYLKKREETIIIAADCTLAKETCFCVAMNGAPYPKVNFDLNLSPIQGFFLVEVGSRKGETIVDKYETFFREAKNTVLAERDKNRRAVTEEVERFIRQRQTPDTKAVKGTVRKNYNLLELWQDSASTCVECGACNLVCPTCHCFLLFDQKYNGKDSRFRIWDSCLYKTFARVAGGANPRRHLYERLRNRFDKKFEFFPEVLDYFACTGCGRCVEACPGDIDIREVLKGLVKGAWKKPPHD